MADAGGLFLKGYYSDNKQSAHITGVHNIGGDSHVGIWVCGFKDEYTGRSIKVSVDKVGITSWLQSFKNITNSGPFYDLKGENIGNKTCFEIAGPFTPSSLQSIPNGKYIITLEIEGQINTLYIYDEY